MKIKAVPFSKFFKNKENIYKNIMVASKRARQIINERYEEMAALNNIEDTDEIVEFEKDNNDKYFGLVMTIAKAISISFSL